VIKAVCLPTIFKAAGTASVVLGSLWALGTFGGHFTPPGQVALASAGGLMNAAHAGECRLDLECVHYC
jgi:hypothetical protein